MIIMNNKSIENTGMSHGFINKRKNTCTVKYMHI